MTRMIGCTLLTLMSVSVGLVARDRPVAPATVAALWAEFDPRKEPLDTKLIREWEEDGVTYRFVTFHIAKFKDKPARMAAFYGFPKGTTKKLPALLHLHGGGQRALLHEVGAYAKRGYACVSLNWGGREMEGARPGDPTTDWGAVDPTQNNVVGYFNLHGSDKTLDSFESPRNNNWYLLTLAAKRGLTFLEDQAEVDPKRLGVFGHSMGGSLTVYVAGSDDRVKAAVPSVGGSGFRTEPWPLLPQERRETPLGDLKLFEATLGFESYAASVKAPLLWLGATNDFHGIMDDTYRTGELIPHEHVRYAFAPHMNHRFTPDTAVTRPLWFEQHLKGNFQFPKTPEASLILETEDQVPELKITPDQLTSVAHVQIYYSIDPDPRARFWRTAASTQAQGIWSAKLPIMSLDQPLFAFANVTYELKKTQDGPTPTPAERYTISSKMLTIAPKELKNAKIKATDKATLLIDDFAGGWQDWYLLEPGNSHHWEFTTHKLADPKWRGPSGHKLDFEMVSEMPNELAVVVTENLYRSSRGKQREYTATVKLKGGAETQPVSLKVKDFKASNGESLSSWKYVDQLTFKAHTEKGGKSQAVKHWVGKPPAIANLRWVP